MAYADGGPHHPTMSSRTRHHWRIPLLLIASLALPVARAAKSTSDDGTRRDFRVVTLNLWHDKADWPRRQAMIVDELQRQQPDVITLQEVLQHDDLPNQARTLAEALGYAYRFSSVDASNAARRYGNALLSRHPIASSSVHDLEPLNDYRTLLQARVRIGDDDIDFYVTHLNFSADGAAIRQRQADDIAATIARLSGDRPAIIAGDFNTDADAPELQPLRDRFIDSYGHCHRDASARAASHSTLNPAFHPAQRIDHVLVDPLRFRVIAVQRILDRPDRDGAWASDHFGVMATLRRLDVSTASAKPDCSTARNDGQLSRSR